VRYEDPERALDLGRAVVAELVEQVLGTWRPRSSGCAGALVLDWQDVYPGAGWGLRDVDGWPKAPWYAVRRAMAPVAVLLRDEGFSGLDVHVFNDRSAPLVGELDLQLYTAYGDPADGATMSIDLGARSETSVNAATLLNGFRDLTHAYRFGPPAYDVVVARLRVDDEAVSEAIHLPGGAARAVEADLGLTATGHRASDGTWQVTVSTRRFAQWVRVDVPGFVPSDSWFHLAPGAARTVALCAVSPPAGGTDRRPSGAVSALNLASSVPVRIEP
jgi:beta-mannosidase